MHRPRKHERTCANRRITFELPPDTATLLPVASCVVVKSSSDSESPLLDAKGKPVIRPYTPISPSEQPGEITFLVKKYDAGKMSKYICEMKPGQSIAIKGPIPKFEYKGTPLVSPSRAGRRVLADHAP